MLGIHDLLAMRRRGYKPRLVIIDVGTDHLRAWSDWQSVSPAQANLQVERADNPLAVDLRAVVGVRVVVHQLEDGTFDRAIAFATAARRAKASLVVACTDQGTFSGKQIDELSGP